MQVRKDKLRLETSVTDGVIYRYLSALNCPRSLSAWLLYKHGEHDQLANLVCKPESFNNPFDFRSAYLATQFLRKADFLKVTCDPKEVALEGFENAERKCLETNTKWKRRNFENFDWNAIHRVARKIESIIGPKPNIERWVDSSSWGPGASLSIKRRDASSFKKFRDERGITVDAAFLIPWIDLFYPHLAGKMFQFEVGDRIVVVPKDATKDRVILIQAGWNLWFQKGLGSLIRSKLRLSGLDLDNGAVAKNQEIARRSSIDGRFATIDFSSASDQIAIEPLREVLPPDWFRLLDLLRSKRSAEGRTWEKFSSMGNGFTFELETLLFYAIAVVSCDIAAVDSSDVSVFGDDVVLPVEALVPFHRLCELFGFTVNTKKSYSSTYFRESCGVHWYNGVDCKPVFLKEKISDVQRAYKAYNKFRWLAHRTSAMMGCDSAFKNLCSFIVRSVPSQFRKLRCPYGFGEIGFIGNFDEAVPSKAKNGYQGYLFRSLVSVPLPFESEEPSLLLVRLTEHSDRLRGNKYEVKDRTKVRIARTYAIEWYDLGPWL